MGFAAAIARTVRDLVDAGNARIVVDAAAARPLSWVPFVPGRTNRPG